jgi:uncharacterized membrane protein SpoIIM required for sporulation/ABC-type transport system involved in multi-copper enzyme maturation permease subunit
MLDKWKPAFIITRREVRDQFRDWRIIIPILALTLIFPSLMNFTAQRAVNFVGRFGADLIGERLIPFLLMVVGFFPISVSLVIALESFVGEKERRSIEPLLSSPLTDTHLYMGKLIAVMVPPLIASYLGIGVYLWGVRREIGWSAEPELLAQILILTFVQALVMVSGAVVISTQATSVRAANLLASFIIIPVAFLIQGEAMVMFWGAYRALWWVVLGLVVLAALLVRTGVSHFNREEMLGRELDTLNLRGGWRTFWLGFTGGAGSLGGWYRVSVKETLRKFARPCGLMFLLILFAGLIGTRLTEDFPLPVELINLENLSINSFSDLGEISLLDTDGIARVWFQNARALALALLLSIFSFGVLGLLVLMLPMVLIGYFMASFAGAGVSPWLFFAGFVLPHGILEIPAIMLVGAGFLYLGGRIIARSEGKSIGEIFVVSLGEWMRVYVGVALPLLALAAVLEVFLTPRVAVWLLGG